MTKRAQKIWAARGFASLTKYGGILELIMPGDTEEAKVTSALTEVRCVRLSATDSLGEC